MPTASRRAFLKSAGWGFAAAGIPGGPLVLAGDVKPTPSDENPAAAEQVLKQMGEPVEIVHLTDDAQPTRSNPLGPAYRSGSPFRGKVCPPFEPGQVMVVSGRVWGYDTKRPLGGAVLDVWHVDINGRYSMGERNFKNRARVISSESGYYEFESVHPVAYEGGPGFWRSAHVHFRISRPGYKTLITELFFEGDPKQDRDPIFNKALLRPVTKKEINGRTVELIAFDIVLESD